MNILKHLDTLSAEQRVEFASSYREQVLRALGIAQTYDGSETKYQELTGTLIALEKWLKDSLGVSSSKRISHRDERRLSSEIFDGKQHIAIDDILAHSGRRFASILQGASPDSLEDFLGSLNIASVALPGIILPPGENTIPEGSGEYANGGREIHFQQRLSQLIGLLQQHGIFTDDLIVCHGEISEHMMRKVSYCIVEIPRLNKQILLCDQVGEATFVIQGNLPRSVLMTLTKEQLQDQYPDLVQRIVYTSSITWEQQLFALLFADGVQAKVDVRDQEALRVEILKIIPTAEMWAGMIQREKLKFKVGGMGLKAIARRFGVMAGDPIFSRKYHWELGRKIYGECEELEYEEQSELTDDQLKTAILEQIPTAEMWMKMKTKEKEKFKIGEMGLAAIATRFGVKGNPLSHLQIYLALGSKIYGESEVFAYEYLNDDQLKAAILVQVPTAEAWAGMNQEKRKAFKVKKNGTQYKKMGLNGLATRFKIEGNPIDNRAYHLALGRVIYGECEALDEREVSPDELKAAILAQVPTAEMWARMKRKEKLQFKAAGMGLSKIATRFGIEGNPFDNRAYRLELGRKIYGECEALAYEEPPELTDEELKAAILAQVPTAEMWTGIHWKEKLTFKIAGMGLMAIARRFGVDGDPLHNLIYFLELGKKIYGVNI